MSLHLNIIYISIVKQYYSKIKKKNNLSVDV